MKRILGAVVAVMGAAAMLLGPVAASADAAVGAYPIAHRGDHDGILGMENTLKAYEDAGRQGILTWETDVHFTRGGVPFIMHDSTLDRTTKCSGPTAGQTMARIDGCVTEADQPIPHLYALLKLAKSYDATVFVEIKQNLTSVFRAALLDRVDSTRHGLER